MDLQWNNLIAFILVLLQMIFSLENIIDPFKENFKATIWLLVPSAIALILTIAMTHTSTYF